MDGKRFKKWIYTHMPWLLAIAFLLLYALSKVDFFSLQIKAFIEKTSFAVLASGVFAGVLKSIQFTGIFKETMEDVVLGTDFIESKCEAKQLELWSAASKAIYNKKFPELSGLIEKRILESYLPTTKDYCYYDYTTTINVEEIDKDFNLTYTETVMFEVVLDHNVDKATLKFNVKLTQEKDENAFEKYEFYKVDDKDVIEDLERKILPDKKGERIHYSLELEKKEDGSSFKIHCKSRKKCPLKNENYVISRFGTFVKGAELLINYPDNVRVSFFNIGSVKVFDEHHDDARNSISRKHKNDVLFPHQGFGMSFERVEPEYN